MTTLALIQENLDKLMRAIDEATEITNEQIDEFMLLREEREKKIDGWIGYRDRAKHFVAELKERRDRFQTAYKTGQSLQKYLDQRIKYHMENDKTGLVFKGKELGTLSLVNNQKAVAHIVPLESVRFDNVVKDDFYKQVCADYLKEVTFRVLDKAKVKVDLLSGIELSWAKLEQGKHIRVKG